MGGAEEITGRRRAAEKRPQACPLCAREVALTFHHLIPRKLHRRSHFRKKHDRETLNKGIYICRKCHRGIHKYYDEMTLGQRLNTLQALRDDAALQRHFEWVSRQREC